MNLDFKVTLVGQLGLIGGTMGLFTGFSVLSAVEFIYFLFKLVGQGFKKKKKPQDNTDTSNSDVEEQFDLKTKETE